MSSLYRFDPLEQIIFHHDFDEGLNGWVVLTPNLRQDVVDYFPAQQRFADWGPPMLRSDFHSRFHTSSRLGDNNTGY